MRIALILLTTSVWWVGRATCFIPSRPTHFIASRPAANAIIIITTTTTSAITTPGSRLYASPEPLESEGDWTAYLDEETTGLVYYFNSRSGESRWLPPSATFPQVYLTPRKRRRAERVRVQYQKSRQLQAEVNKRQQSVVEPKVAVLSTSTSTQEDATAETPKATAAKREEPNWFGSFFDDKSKQKPSSEEPNWFAGIFEERKKIKEEPNWLDALWEEPAVANTKATKKEEAVVTAKKENDESSWFSGMFQDKAKEPNWIGDLFDDTKKQTQQQQPVGTEPTSIASTEEPGQTEESPTWVEDRWLAATADKRLSAPAVTEKPAGKTEEKPPKKEAKKEKRQPFTTLFRRGAKDEVDPINGDAAVAEPVAKEAKVVEKKVAEKKEAKAVEKKPKAAPRRVSRTMEVEAKPKGAEDIVTPVEEVPIKIDMSAYVLPHPAKVLWGGEDFIFTQGRTFGVFDGVSGAAKTDGVVLYPKALANQMKKLVPPATGLSIPELTNYLTQAAEVADKRATGASTAVVASIDDAGTLHVLNLGDSCCIVIRDEKIVAKTTDVSHFYECPYQLARDSPDRPKDGTRMKIGLRRGDVVLMGSDGIFDNLTDNEILVTVLNSPARSSLVAKRVVELSRRVSLDPNALTPYAKSAKLQGDDDYKDGKGGKLDDVSCVVVRYT